MSKFNGIQFAKDMISAVKLHVDNMTAPLTKRVDDIDARLKALEDKKQ